MFSLQGGYKNGSQLNETGLVRFNWVGSGTTDSVIMQFSLTQLDNKAKMFRTDRTSWVGSGSVVWLRLYRVNAIMSAFHNLGLCED